MDTINWKNFTQDYLTDIAEDWNSYGLNLGLVTWAKWKWESFTIVLLETTHGGRHMPTLFLTAQNKTE